MAQQVSVDIGYRPRPWQANVHRSMRRFSVLVVHRRGGKTVMAIAELVDKALRCRSKMGRFAYIAPLRNQAKTIAWEYIKDFTKDIPGLIKNESELYVEFPNGARITLYGADNPDAIRGAYLDGCVLDEYADMKGEMWSKVIRPMLADRKGWAVFIGTPKGHNEFFEIYKLALKRMNAGEDWYATLLPHWETGALDQSELDDAREEMGDLAFAQEFGCDFAVEAEDVLIPIKLAEQAQGKHLSIDQYKHSARVIGVDVARFGDDSSVIQKRQGLYGHEQIVIKDIDNMELADRVAFEVNEYKPDAVFIDAGRGEGVIDRLRQLGYEVQEVNFGGKSLNSRYRNMAMYMWAEMKQWLTEGGALPEDPSLLTELVSRTYKFGAGGIIELEPKDKLKERFRSPDRADALALTFARPVQPHVDILHHVPETGTGLTDYTPW